MCEALFAQPIPLPGNLAKVRVLCRLADRLVQRSGPLRVLDVGCAGPTPFNHWHAFLEHFPGRVILTGIDVRGLEPARAQARARGWEVELLPGSAYTMAEDLRRTFEVVVSTQVLEHLRRPEVFFAQLARVLEPGGTAYLTMDSAHFPRHGGLRERVRDLLAPLLPERYHDEGLTVEQARSLAQAAGLEVTDLRLYNLGGLKAIHNHRLASEHRNRFLRQWYAFEEALNAEPALAAAARAHFAGIYLELRRG
jgi:SAM-dependent methyltransferase